jgi:flavorubredoxin
MAEAIAGGITAADSTVAVKLHQCARSDKSDILTEIFKAKALLVGSPTVNRGILSAVGGVLEEVKGLAFKNKKAAAFGTYGWSGESVKILTEKLKDAGFEIVHEGLRVNWSPDRQAVESCIALGREVAAKLR